MGSATNPSGSVRVAILVEHRMVREGLSMLLRADREVELVGAVATPKDLAASCRTETPDVVVVDLDDPGTDSTDLGEHLHRACPHAQLVGVAESDETGLAHKVLELDLAAVYVKTDPSDELIDLVKRAGKGERVLPAERATGRLIAPVRAAGPALTPREHEVLRNLAEGRGTAQVARHLEISPLTVQSHVKRILEKLGVHSKIEAVTWAFRVGLVDVPGARASGDQG